MSTVRCPACNDFIIAPPGDGCPSRDVHAAAAEAVLDGFEMGKRREDRRAHERLHELRGAAVDVLAYPVGHGAGRAYRNALKRLRDVVAKEPTP